MYKVMKFSEPIDWVNKPEVKSSVMNEGPCGAIRGNSLRVLRESFPSKRKNNFGSAVSVRHGFFLNSFVPDWNGLPETVIQSKTVNGFKAAFDRLNGIGCHNSTSSQDGGRF